MDAETIGRRRKGEPAIVRVHRAASLPVSALGSPDALTAELNTLVERKSISRRAWVNLWDLPGSHQHLLLPSASDAELEEAARHHGAAVLGISDGDVTISLLMGELRGEPGHHQKREVSLFAAASRDVHERLRPVAAAGFVIEGVTTPCGALWADARLRRAPVPRQARAHVAIGASRSALGIVGGGSLLYARDLDWGYAASSPDGAPGRRDREVVASELAAELRRSFLYLKQYCDSDVFQVLLCGDMPDLRSLTAPLGDRLHIEIETLDTCDGFDAATLPEGFSDCAAMFRLASAIAAEPPPMNLLPAGGRAAPPRQGGLRIAMGGTAAAIALSGVLYGQARAGEVWAERRTDALRREAASVASAERAAPKPQDAQDPVMAYVLESLSHAAVDGVSLRSIRAVADGDRWNVTLDVISVHADPAAARAAADQFVRALERTPVFRGAGRPAQSRVRAIPDGAALEATYTVRR